MPFVHSALFWAGAGLISIPIIIHLITRRRFRRLDWAAMEFLLQALRRNRRRIRLEQLLLLLMRIALVALIALAVARPHLSQAQYGWLSGPFRSEEKVFILDDSQSMGHVEAGRSSLERSVEALGAALERVAADGGRDPVTIVRSSRYQVPLASAVTVDAERLESLRQALEGTALFPTATRLDPAPVLEDLSSSSREERGRAIYILTDLAAADWTDGQGGPDEALRRAMERYAGETANARIIVVDVGPKDHRNVSITDLAVETPNPIVGIPVELRLEVTNFGRDVVRGVATRLRTPTSLTPGPRIAEIAPGATAQLRLPHVFTAEGLREVTAELEGAQDGLAADDTRTVVARVAREIEVLLVDGEPSGVPGEGETDYLAQALRPQGELSSGLAPSIVVESNVPLEELDRFGIVFLANLGTVSPELGGALRVFVERGGALVIFAGDQLDAPRYESALGPGTPEAPGADLLPATLGELIGSDAQPVHLSPDFDHPAFRLLAGGEDILFRLVEITRAYALAPREDARVLARATDVDQSPLVVERQSGKGRVVLFGLPADVEWSNWPRNPSFLPVVQELVGAVARPLGSGWTRLAGSAIEHDIDLARYQREARLRSPDYPTTPEVKLLATPIEVEEGDVASRRFRFRIEDTRRAGVYSLTLKTVTGEEETLRFGVNAHGSESDLRPVDAGALEGFFEGVDLTVIRDPAAALASDQGRFEIADAMLALFLLVLLAEGTLAWWFAHHRRAGATETTRAVPEALATAVRAGHAGGGR